MIDCDTMSLSEVRIVPVSYFVKDFFREKEIKMNRVRLPKQTKPLKAIRCMCISCMGGDTMQDCKELIRDCASHDCPLYDFRMGVNPHHGHTGTAVGYGKTPEREEN